MRELLRDLGTALSWPDVPFRYLTARKLLNYWRCQLAWLRGTETVNGRPHHLVVELTNVCNLRCPHCPTGRGRLGRRPSFMALDDLERVLDELAPYAFVADLHNWGEPLLHERAVEAIRLFEARRVMTIVSTNFNVPFDADKAEALVRSGLSVLGVSLDGADQETYATYRVRGKLGVALHNARLVVEARARLRATRPRVIWTYLVFRHNEGRVHEARAFARWLGMEFSTVRGLAPSDPTWETTRSYHHPAIDLLGTRRACRHLYGMAAINADLGVSACCAEAAFDGREDFGNVRTGAFRAVWNGERHRAARRLFRTLEGRSTPAPTPVCCEQCSIYTSRRGDGAGARR